MTHAIPGAVRVRSARPQDAPGLAEMANDLNAHVGIHTRPFTAARVLADGFGPAREFTPLVAELAGTVVGYAFCMKGYNTDFAGRTMWLHDLFVAPAARRHGVGRALMAAVAAEAVRQDCRSVEWGVHEANAGAFAFYRRLGATGGEIRILSVEGERLRALAADGERSRTP